MRIPFIAVPSHPGGCFIGRCDPGIHGWPGVFIPVWRTPAKVQVGHGGQGMRRRRLFLRLETNWKWIVFCRLNKIIAMIYGKEKGRHVILLRRHYWSYCTKRIVSFNERGNIQYVQWNTPFGEFKFTGFPVSSQCHRLINRGRTDVHSGIYSDQLASQVDKSVCNPERVITCSRGEKKVIELQSNWKSARVLITCTSDALALMSLHWWGGHVRDCTLRVIQRCSFHSYILHSSFLQ